jgi:hypothetical protein
VEAANGEVDALAHWVQGITGLCTGRLPEDEVPLDAANPAIGRRSPAAAVTAIPPRPAIEQILEHPDRRAPAAPDATARGLPLCAGRPRRPRRRTRTAGLPMREDAFGPPRIEASA